MEDNKNIKKDEQLTPADIESLEILQKVHEKKGKQLTINAQTGALEEVNELRQLIGKQFENPEEKYQVYYSGIIKLLMDHLPKGQDFKQVRDIIYDEKNIFLNAGKRKSDNKGIRKSDGRMTFQPVMNEILDVVVKWVAESQVPFEIYRAFYELNEKHGYPHEDYDPSTRRVASAMLALTADDN